MKNILLFFSFILLLFTLTACKTTDTEPLEVTTSTEPPVIVTTQKPVVPEKDGVGPIGTEIRSVNLGGWFVLERWMTPSLFRTSNVIGNDETDFVSQAENAQEKLEAHWSTFITQEDMYYIAKQGITNVRIPIPWWLFGEGAKASDYIDFDALPTNTEEEIKHKEYLVNTKEYIRSVEFLDKAMDMAKNAGLTVMLDLHTAPGCQNGFDNGGIQGVPHWGRGTSFEKTLEILEKIAIRYKDHPALHSIEVANEPAHWVLDRNGAVALEDKGINRLQAFSLEAYEVIRKHVPEHVYVIFHDGFWTDAWINFFRNNDLKNVALDLHRYQVFNAADQTRKLPQHLFIAEYDRAKEIRKMQNYVNIFIGEWSLGLPSPYGNATNEKSYAKAQLIGMKAAWGWSFWSYKLEGNTGWNFKSVVDRKIMDPKMWIGELEE